MKVFSKEKELSSVSSTPKSDDYGTIFKSANSDLIYIGEAPQTTRGISGCIRDIMYNDRKIGLWDFFSTSGQCVGCIR